VGDTLAEAGFERLPRGFSAAARCRRRHRQDAIPQPGTGCSAENVQDRYFGLDGGRASQALCRKNASYRSVVALLCPVVWLGAHAKINEENY